MMNSICQEILRLASHYLWFGVEAGDAQEGTESVYFSLQSKPITSKEFTQAKLVTGITEVKDA